MEVSIYKLIYKTKIDKKLEDKILHADIEPKVKKEFKSNKYIRILGHYFVKNNKNKAKLVINNKKSKLKELVYYVRGPEKFKDDKLKINLILGKELSNISHIFENCTKLKKFSIYDNIARLEDEEPLDYLNDITYNNQNRYNNSLSLTIKNDYIFSNSSICSINKGWFDDNITKIVDIKENIFIDKYQYNFYFNMSRMYYNCFSLSSLPDISEWNTDYVRNMDRIFENCFSLFSLPDISKWDTHNICNISRFFSGCSSLLSLPDISKWDIRNVCDMSEMFYECSSLSSLPDISKWDTKKVTNMNGIFYNCSSLLSLPNISKWNTHNVNNE